MAILLAVLPLSSGRSADWLPGPVAARVERVIDGDTVEVRARIWIDQEILIAVRVADIDAPELFRPRCSAEKARALEAKAFAADFFSDGGAALRDVRYGKYAGRVVARIENSAGEAFADAIVAAGLAALAADASWCGLS